MAVRQVRDFPCIDAGLLRRFRFRDFAVVPVNPRPLPAARAVLFPHGTDPSLWDFDFERLRAVGARDFDLDHSYGCEGDQACRGKYGRRES